jgi:hypothetical protein
MTMNDGLGNTAIEDLVLDPATPEHLYVATTAGVFKSPDGGAGAARSIGVRTASRGAAWAKR